MPDSVEVATVSSRREIARPFDDGSPDQLLALALEGGNVEAVEKLVALKERAEDRAAERALYAALAELQANSPAIPKTRTASIATKTGSSYSYSFATLDGIRRAIGPTLAALGLSYSWDTRLDGTNVTVVCRVRHILGASTSAEFVAPVESDGRKSGAQSVASTTTYGKRQSLVNVFGLTIFDEDTDAAMPDPAKERPLSDDQIETLRSWLKKSGAKEKPWLAYLGVDSFDEITAGMYDNALATLKQKTRRAASQEIDG